MDPRIGPVTLLFLMVTIPLLAGLLLDGLILDRLMPSVPSEGVVASVGSAVQGAVTGTPAPSGTPGEVIRSIETPFRAFGILVNNSLVLLYVVLSSSLGLYLSRRTGDVRFSLIGCSLALVPLPWNSFSAGLVTSLALRSARLEALPLVMQVVFMELLAIALPSAEPARAVTGGTPDLRTLYSRIPLSVLLLSFSASIESWFISLA